jgi:hypothetical protein
LAFPSSPPHKKEITGNSTDDQQHERITKLLRPSKQQPANKRQNNHCRNTNDNIQADILPGEIHLPTSMGLISKSALGTNPPNPYYTIGFLIPKA